MTIKSFSPLQTSTTTYYLNLDSYKGAELMFDDATGIIYAMIIRKDYTYPDRYYILENLKLSGYNNGTKYDYRVDLNNYIKIVHSDPVVSTITSHVHSIDSPDNACEIKLVLSTTNPLTANSAIINTTLGNGQLYIASSNINALTGDRLVDTWIFRDNNAPSISVPTKFYTETKIIIGFGLTGGNTLNYIIFFDSDGVYVDGYGWDEGLNSSATSFKTYLIDVPVNAASVMYVINGQSPVTTVVNTCARNQYFYYGTDKVIDSIICTGKRERVENITKDTIRISNKNKIIKITKDISYLQNTGFNITDTQLFDISVSPFLFEFDSSFNITKWLLNNTTMEGFSTKNLSEKNILLDLRQDDQHQRHTNFENNFYE